MNSLDPINIADGGVFNAGGVRYFNNATGDTPTGPAQGFIIYASGTDVGTFGKATGLGDMELTCDLPTFLEIGNRVWLDSDGDGIQDACEAPIANVPVSLYTKAGVLIARDTTTATGEDYFST